MFTDHLSWRWAFYVNVPIAVLVVIIAARTIPGRTVVARPKLDYRGALCIAIGAGGLTLATSWGGTRYAWASPTIVGLFAVSVLALLVFVRQWNPPPTMNRKPRRRRNRSPRPLEMSPRPLERKNPR